MNGSGPDKAGEPRDGAAVDPTTGSGEGSSTALEALIRKRKLRAEDESPAATCDPQEPDAPVTP